MKIGILQTGEVRPAIKAEMGDYTDSFALLLSGYGFEFDTYRVYENEFPDTPDAADGWLITGSRHGAYEDHDWIPPLEELIRGIKASGKPMVGVCFGHQIIAQALGGVVEKFSGGWAIGPQIYENDQGDTISLNAYHQDQVIKLPKGAKAEWHNSFCEFAAMSIGDRIYTIQPHPEFSKEYVELLIEHAAQGVVPEDVIANAEARLSSEIIESQKIADRFAALFKSAA